MKKAVVFVFTFLVIGVAVFLSAMTAGTSSVKANAPAVPAGDQLSIGNAQATAVPDSIDQQQWLQGLGLKDPGDGVIYRSWRGEYFKVQLNDNGTSYSFYTAEFSWQALMAPTTDPVTGEMVYVKEGYRAVKEITAKAFFDAIVYYDQLIPASSIREDGYIIYAPGVPTPTPAS